MNSNSLQCLDILKDGLNFVGSLQVVALYFLLLTCPFPSVPFVLESAQSLLKDKSQMGVEVRLVSVWRVIYAQFLADVL